MNLLGKISHENEVIDKKVKLFYDYFHSFLSKNEYLRLQNHPLNNHLTLFQKIDYRLNQDKLESSSKVILKKLVQNKMFNSSDEFSKKQELSIIIKKIRMLLSQPNISISELKEEVEKGVIYLNDSYNYESINYLDKCIHELISYLSCGCDLSVHKAQIIYYSKLISSEFIRHNFKLDELTRGDGLFNKILSKEINIEPSSNYTYTNFPLPEEIEKLRENTPEFNEKVEEFLSNRTFKQQFQGIVNYLQKEESPSYFIVKVANVNTREEFKNIFGEYEIFTKSYFDMIKINLPQECHENLDRFSNQENIIFIKIQVKSKSKKNAKQIAFSEAENVLSYLNYPNETKGYIDKSEIIEIFEESISYSYTHEILRIAHDNGYILDKSIENTRLYTQLKNLDKLYFRAFTSNLTEDKIVNAWRYIEILAKYANFSNDNIRIKKIPYILMCSEEHITKTHLDLLIFNLIYNNQTEVNSTISHKEFHNISGKPIDIDFLQIKTNYYFTNELIDISKKFTVLFNESYNRYKTQFELLYEQRNYIIHQSEICSIDIDSFIEFIQNLLKRIRRSIIDYIKLTPDTNLKDAIEYLITTGQAKMEE
ncbi:hypothetical protein [Pontimicrobium sp. SW4]|uniref:Apea-like HEPN domain-containing protein n=1 Tax=Pontimicrobium sp. SW4 TaxID=3153519 RepID=A0AAU7BR10_9FLAO